MEENHTVCESCGCYNHTSSYEQDDCTEFLARRAEFDVLYVIDTPAEWNSLGLNSIITLDIE